MRSREISFRIIRAVVIAYIFLLITMFFMEPQMLFPRMQPPAGAPEQYGLKDFQQITITTADKIKLTCWFKQSTTNNSTLIYFYGNNDSLRGYEKFFQPLGNAGYSVLSCNYRGYADSEGKPSENGLYEDAKAQINFAKTFTPLNRIIVIGRSLGTGVAVEMAKDYQLGGLVLISPYTSIPDVAAGMFPYLPVHLISRYSFNSLAKIPDVNAPILLIHGQNDTLIPIANSEKLLAAAKAQKQLIIYPEADHIHIGLDKLAKDIIKFANAAEQLPNQ